MSKGKEDRYFEALRDLGSRGEEAARGLLAVGKTGLGWREELARQQERRQADREALHRLAGDLERAFITPWEREDLWLAALLLEKANRGPERVLLCWQSLPVLGQGAESRALFGALAPAAAALARMARELETAGTQEANRQAVEKCVEQGEVQLAEARARLVTQADPQAALAWAEVLRALAAGLSWYGQAARGLSWAALKNS